MKKYLLAATLLAGLTVTAQAQEFYINPFAGMLVTDTTARVGQNPVQIVPDMGGDALMAGVRLGIQSTGDFLYGAELEAFGANGRSRLMLNNGDTYTVNYDYGMGAYGRIGWRTRGQSLAFFRVGVLNTNVDTRVDFGIGAEVPFSEKVRFRVDLGYAPGDIEFYRLTAGVVFAF